MDNEVYPLRDVNLEEKVVTHQFVDNLVNCVIELKEFLKLVVLIVENELRFRLIFFNFYVLSFEIFSHVEEKLK